jgi:hypothetical protein
MRFESLFLSFCLFGLLGCIKTIDLAPPVYKQEPVLSGLLNPDSLIQIQLTYSFPANSAASTPVPIQAAHVVIAEDDVLLPLLTEQKPGIYTLNYRPKEGRLYSITANTATGISMTAQDRVPQRSLSSATLTGPNPNNWNNNPDIILKLSPVDHTSAIRWISTYNRERRSISLTQYEIQTYTRSIQSNSLLLDDFNGDLLGKNFQRLYWPYARIKPSISQASDQATIVFSTTGQISDVDKPGEYYKLVVWTGSPVFDQYLRSVVIAHRNRISDDRGLSDNPFAQPSAVSSNIENGKGIFASYVTQHIMLKEVK